MKYNNGMGKQNEKKSSFSKDEKNIFSYLTLTTIVYYLHYKFIMLDIYFQEFDCNLIHWPHNNQHKEFLKNGEYDDENEYIISRIIDVFST